MSNRYKTTKQSLPIAAWVIGCCVAACFVGFGIKFLMVKYAVFNGGKTVKQMEVRLARLQISNEDLKAEVDGLTSLSKLERKQAEGTMKLRKISEEKDVIHVNRDDKLVAWKDGVSFVASREATPGKKPEDDAGGKR